jgi:hypothetical protein
MNVSAPVDEVQFVGYPVSSAALNPKVQDSWSSFSGERGSDPTGLLQGDLVSP